MRQPLKDFQDLLHIDCHKGWLSIFHEFKGRFDLQPSWAHARHRFVKMLRDTSGTTKQEIRIALRILFLIRKMFRIEKGIRGWTPEESLEVRKKCNTVMEQSIRNLIDKHWAGLKDSTCLAGAMDCLDDSWKLFQTFLSYGKACLTTNLIEEKIQAAATGRNIYGRSMSLKQLLHWQHFALLVS